MAGDSTVCHTRHVAENMGAEEELITDKLIKLLLRLDDKGRTVWNLAACGANWM